MRSLPTIYSAVTQQIACEYIQISNQQSHKTQLYVFFVNIQLCHLCAVKRAYLVDFLSCISLITLLYFKKTLFLCLEPLYRVAFFQ